VTVKRTEQPIYQVLDQRGDMVERVSYRNASAELRCEGPGKFVGYILGNGSPTHIRGDTRAGVLGWMARSGVLYADIMAGAFPADPGR
jgi:hypothetical protein